MERRAYLDTHIVIWLRDGELSKISRTVAGIIETHDLVISPFVKLELQYLAEIGRLAENPETTVAYLRDAIGLQVCRLPAEKIVDEAMKITWTGDPFDRLITANAAAAEAVLLSKDSAILANYSRARFG